MYGPLLNSPCSPGLTGTAGKCGYSMQSFCERKEKAKRGCIKDRYRKMPIGSREHNIIDKKIVENLKRNILVFYSWCVFIKLV